MEKQNVVVSAFDWLISTAEAVLRQALTDLTPLLVPLVPSSMFGITLYHSMERVTNGTFAFLVALVAAAGYEGFGFTSGQSYFRAVQNGDDDRARGFLYTLIVYAVMGAITLWAVEAFSFDGNTEILVIPLIGTMFLIVSCLVYWLLGYRYALEAAPELEAAEVKAELEKEVAETAAKLEIEAMKAEHERRQKLANAQTAAQIKGAKAGARTAPSGAREDGEGHDTRQDANDYARYAQLSDALRGHLRTVGTEFKTAGEFKRVDVESATGLSPRQANTVISHGIEVGIVEQVARGRYCVNGFDFSKVEEV